MAALALSWKVNISWSSDYTQHQSGPPVLLVATPYCHTECHDSSLLHRLWKKSSSWGTLSHFLHWKGTWRHVIMFPPLEGHPRGHFITFCPLEGHPRRHFITFCSIEGHPRGHLITFPPQEGNPREHFITFFPLERHPRGQLITFCQIESLFSSLSANNSGE